MVSVQKVRILSDTSCLRNMDRTGFTSDSEEMLAALYMLARSTTIRGRLPVADAN